MGEKTVVTVEEVPAAVYSEEWEYASYTIGNTRRFARCAHGAQTDKNGLPYVTHLDAVARNLGKGADVELIKAAYLHDVLEDTRVTAADLEDQGFSERTIAVVHAVTKLKNEPNYNYTTRVIKAGPDAMRVKLADLYHNSLSSRMEKLPYQTQDRLQEKYYSAIFRIEHALVRLGHMTEEQRTMTFEVALKAVKPTYGGSTVGQWWKRPPQSIMKGDKMRFPSIPDKEYLVESRRTTKGGNFAFKFVGEDKELVVTPDVAYESKFGTWDSKTTAYTPVWKKRLGLPSNWLEGDEVPEELEGEEAFEL